MIHHRLCVGSYELYHFGQILDTEPRAKTDADNEVGNTESSETGSKLGLNNLFVDGEVVKESYERIHSEYCRIGQESEEAHV